MEIKMIRPPTALSSGCEIVKIFPITRAGSVAREAALELLPFVDVLLTDLKLLTQKKCRL